MKKQKAKVKKQEAKKVHEIVTQRFHSSKVRRFWRLLRNSNIREFNRLTALPQVKEFIELCASEEVKELFDALDKVREPEKEN